MTTIEKKETPLGKSYWANNGAYQVDRERLYDKLVPASGEAETIHGEMIRSVSRLFYDYCNNGNCNAVDIKMEECHQCGGCGYEEFYDGDDEEGDEEEPEFIDVDDLSSDQDIMRVLISPSMADQFAKRALSVVNAGRLPCPFCGGPIDMRGHLCPRANGYRR